jgi:hypothetical protein
MAARGYFLVSALPSMGELGAAPPWTPVALLEHVRETGGPAAVVEALLLGDDLLQRDALLAGEIEETRTAVLTPEQAADEMPLPAHLVPGGDEEVDEDEEREVVRHAGDAIWLAWFRHAAEVGRRRCSRFLPGVEWARGGDAQRAGDGGHGLRAGPGDYRMASDLSEAGVDSRT